VNSCCSRTVLQKKNVLFLLVHTSCVLIVQKQKEITLGFFNKNKEKKNAAVKLSKKKKATLGEMELSKINVSEILSIHQIKESKLLLIHTRYGLC